MSDRTHRPRTRFSRTDWLLGLSILVVSGIPLLMVLLWAVGLVSFEVAVIVLLTLAVYVGAGA